MNTNIMNSQEFQNNHCLDNDLDKKEVFALFQNQFPVITGRQFTKDFSILRYTNIPTLERAFEYSMKARNIINEYHLPLEVGIWIVKQSGESEVISMSVTYKP